MTDNGNNNNKNNKENGNKDKDKDDRSVAEVIVDLATDNSSLFFRDQYGIAYALVKIADHNEICRMESARFKRYLSRLYYEEESRVANAEALTNAIHVLQAKAEHEGQTIHLSLRVAWHGGDIYYDMTNEKWECIKISKGHWHLLQSNEIPIPMFMRYNQTTQVQPNQNYEKDIMDKFLQTLTNVKDDKNKLLLKVYIVSLFIPDIPHVMLILHGQMGSAKSTLQTLIKLLVDPAKPRLLTIYNDVKEFIQQLAHNHVAYYDNLKRTPLWLSDESCKAVTGVGSTKRKLYSDDDDIVYEYRRCLGFNGLNVALTEPDALDRSMMIELDRIKKENERTEEEIMSEFEKLRPGLLAYICDILARALEIKPTLRLQDLPRMADFAIWSEAIARAMGYQDLEFLNAYYENIGKQNVEAIQNHPLGQVIVRYIAEHQTCEGSPSEVLEILEIFAIENKIKTDHRLWPKAANSFTRRLNQISSNLLEGPGIDVQVTRITDIKGKANTSSIKISQIPPIPPIPPADHNHEGNLAKTAGGTLTAGDIIPPASEIPPVKMTENHAQNRVTGDTGDTGGIFSTEGGPSTYEHLTETEYFPNLNRTVYYCKEHPEVPYYDLAGIEESHFKPCHS
jgi:hypothetical protein